MLPGAVCLDFETKFAVFVRRHKVRIVETRIRSGAFDIIESE
jgi:hypothetical protein